MKLSENTLAVLKNYSSINQSIKISNGNTIATMSPLKTVLSRATVADTFDKSFCIYDLGRFLSTLSLFKSPDLEFTDTSVVISEDKQKVVYRYCDEKMIVIAPSNDITFPSPEVSFDLTPEALTSIVKATSVLGLPDIAIVGEGGKLYLRSVNIKDAGSDEFNVQIGETEYTFKAVFKPEYLAKLTSATYKVEVSSKNISRFTGDNIVYYIATEATSKFN